jgi:hypothetical protein
MLDVDPLLLQLQLLVVLLLLAGMGTDNPGIASIEGGYLYSYSTLSREETRRKKNQ